MGQVKLPDSGSIYVDSCVFIYCTERIEPFFTCAEPLWRAIDTGTHGITTSAITLMEVLVKPFRNKDAKMVDLYRRLLTGTERISCMPLTLPNFEAAAELRASINLKTPDAIHAASALASSTALFVTNDSAFKRVAGLNVAVISEVLAT